MKYTIDTEKKEIQLESELTLEDLQNLLELIPNHKEYKIIPKIIYQTTYVDKIVLKEQPYQSPLTNPFRPYVNPYAPLGQDFYYTTQI